MNYHDVVQSINKFSMKNLSNQHEITLFQFKLNVGVTNDHLN